MEYISVESLRECLRNKSCSIDTITGDLLYIDKTDPNRWVWRSVLDDAIKENSVNIDIRDI